jgi:hypothetical protein
MAKEKVSTRVQSDIVATIDEHAENRSAWLREAVAEKLARDGDRKRHLHVTDPIELELSEFEAMYLGRLLWEYSHELPDERRETARWWVRRLDAMRKTRDDGF